MSLILDALRKADAERERGSVPSLHSHPVVPLAAEAPAQPRARSSWMWMAIGVVLVVFGIAAWVTVMRESPPSSPPVVASSPPPPSALPLQTAPPPAGVPVQPPIAAPGAPTGGSALPAAVAPGNAPPVAEPAPWPQAEDRRTPRPETRADAPVPVLGNVPPAEPQVYSREQLPPEIRAQLPQFTIGGSIYSPNPSGRSLIVNGQLFREKDRLTQDLSLEEIKLKAAVFSFRGYRFEVLF